MSVLPHTDEDAPRPAWAGRLILATLFGLFALNVFWLWQNWSQMKPVPRGKAAPEFSVPLLTGGEFQLTAHRGHPVFVDFWATWCGPCRESLPVLDRVYQRHKEAGLAVVAVETESAEAEARQLVAQLGLHLPVGLGDGELSGRYGASSIPHLVLINKKGQVKRVFRGVHSEEELSNAARDAEAEVE